MRFYNPVKYLLLLLCSLTLTVQVWAQDFSYIYIQGDKETPFYVKFEGEMLPRYGKNYIIIPMLAPGPVNIEVLFQQNRYPAQKYVIQVPESGFRGFILKNNSGTFSLYDIYQKYYIHPGNKAIDDKSPDSDPSEKFVTTNTALASTTNSPTPKTTSTNTTSRPTQPSSNSPKFIADIQINSGNNTSNSGAKSVVAQTYKPTTTQEQNDVVVDDKSTDVVNNSNEPAIINSDCPQEMGNSDFEDIYKRAIDKSEKQRLKYLLSQMNLCYSTSQARSLALILSNDPEKYTFLKRVYPRITDQSAFPPLENLLSTNEWKSYFRLILPE